MSNYTLTLPLKTEKFQEDRINKAFEEYRKIYNSCLFELHKRYNHLRESKAYRNNCKYKGKDRNKIFNTLNQEYNLTEYSLHEFIKPMAKYYKTNVMITQKIATRAFNAFKGLIFHTAKSVKYKGYGELNSIEGKNHKQSIIYRDGLLLFNGMKIPTTKKSKDEYDQQALLSPIKYCRIKREIIKGKYHYYVQFMLEGTPPVKFNRKTGELKGIIGKGKVGIDIGTQIIAYSSKYEVKLLELAPNVNKIDRETKLLQRKMDRSKRATNHNKYNDNGTIKKGNKEKWIKSNHYVKLQMQYKEMFRKQSSIRKQDHSILANQLLVLGNEFYVENMSFAGLQKRSKKTTINSKTGRINKKKRFGKSISNKAPAMFLTILNDKLNWNGTQLFKINTTKVKASQYNHFTDTCKKKELSERWNYFNIRGEEFKIQRDMYSAFLIMNIYDNLKEINKELCYNEFDNFKKLHDKEVNRIINSDNKIISSMGI